MRIVKRVVLGFLVLLTVALTAAFFYARHLARKGLPDYNADVALRGMTGTVVVYRDAYAVPHIFAKNENDLYRATGYVMAQDRLWQMDLVRRATSGRLSEIFGKIAVDADLQMRLVQIPEKSKRMLTRTEPAIVRALEAFADGVNQYIESHRKNLPLEFSLLGYAPEPWAPEHSLNLIGYIAWMGSNSTTTESQLYRAGRTLGFDSEKYRELLPDTMKNQTLIHPGFKLGPEGRTLGAWLTDNTHAFEALGVALSPASNNWAVSGERSVTGKPLVANDMHLEFGLPGIWYQIHLAVEGRLDATGVALPGAPVVVAGHNERIAWGFTFVHQDAMDFFRETINPQNPGEYKFNGTWRPLDIRREVIRVKGGTAIEKAVRSTHRGPIVSDARDFAAGEAVSMRWLGMNDSNELRGAYLLNRARNWDEFKTAMKDFVAVGVNTVYGDVDGNIGLYTCAGVPIRKGRGLMVRPGDTDEFDWTGIVPFEDLPHSYNPPEGEVSSANNKPAGDDYPYPIGEYFETNRIARIREMLGEKQPFAVEDFARMQADIKLTRAEKTVPVVTAELDKATDLSPLERRSFDLLKSWDFQTPPESPTPLIYETLYRRLSRNLVEDELGPDGIIMASRYFMEYVLAHPESGWWDDVRTKDVRETRADIILKSFREAVAAIAKDHGNDPSRWAWGMDHTLTLRHPMAQVVWLDRIFHLNRGPYQMGGSQDTVCPFSFPAVRNFQAAQGPSHRHIFDTADWNRSLTVIPAGESGVPASRHYADQTSLYLKNAYHADYVSRDLIEKSAKYKMTMTGK
jgi:penicillin amidase